MNGENNNIPEGFKMTEIGLLPDEWETTKLGDLFEIKQGKALSPGHRRGISPRPFLRTANVFWGYLDLTTVDSMDFTDAEVSQLKLMPNDLLVCEGGDIGRTAIWRDESKVYCYQNHLHRLRTSRDDVHPLFYMYWMQVAYLLLRLYGGTGNKTTIPNLSQSRLKSFVLPLPPLPEQKAIARVLSTIQKAVETQDKIIAAARELKKSLMRHLFTYGPVPVAEAEKVPLKETEIGPVPEHWEVAILKQLGSLKDGDWILKSDYSKDGVRLLQIADIGLGKFINKSRRFISLQRAQELGCTFLKGGDILISRMADPIGRACMLPDLPYPTITAVDVTIFRVNPDLVDSYYVLNILNSEIALAQAAQLAYGVTRNRVTRRNLERVLIPFPPLPEQQEIARMLLAVDNKIDAEENRKAALQALFKTMLHQLMTGKVRVKGLEATAG